MDHQSNNKRHSRDHGAFLDSMTFATSAANCDCDDCGIREVPSPILEAVQAHKRSKLLQNTLMRTQQRELVRREGGVSIWKHTMPPGAEPLREFGNTHRVLLVDQLSERVVKSIGTGIIGSREEESGRTTTNWTQGSAFFVKSNEGQMIGWINEKTEEKYDELENVVFYAIKVTKSDILQIDDTASTTRSLVVRLLRKCLSNGTEKLDFKDTEFLQNLIKKTLMEDN